MEPATKSEKTIKQDFIPVNKQEESDDNLEQKQKDEIEKIMNKLIDLDEDFDEEIVESDDESDDESESINSDCQHYELLILGECSNLHSGQTFKILDINNKKILATKTECPYNFTKLTNYILLGLAFLLLFVVVYKLYGFDLMSIMKWIIWFYIISYLVKLFL